MLRKVARHATARLATAALLLPLLQLGQIPQSHAQSSVNALREQFFHEAPPSWKKYAELVEGLNGSSRYQSEVEGKKTQGNVQYKSNSNAKLVIRTIHDDKAVDQTAFGVNPRYAFIVRRKGAVSPWIVTQVYKMAGGELPYAIDRELKNATKMPCLAIRNESLLDMIQRSSFRVRDVRRVEKDQQEFVQVEFVYERPVGSGPQDSPVQGGKLRLDPKRYWTVQSAELDLKTQVGKGKFKVENYLEEFPDVPFPLPKRYSYSEEFTLKDGGVFRAAGSVKFDLVPRRHLPSDEEFTLSAFGLPEPYDAGSRPTPWYLWCAGVGLASIAVGAIFLRLKRRAGSSASG